MPTTLNEWVEALQGALASIGIVAAGLWAYYHYFKGRTYRPRLGLKVAGKFHRKGSATYLLVEYSLKNEGLGRVSIEPKGSGLRVLTYLASNASGGTGGQLEQQRVSTLPVFEGHGWIEPGERIDEETLLPVPTTGAEIAGRLELRIVSRGIEWNARRVVLDEENHDGEHSDRGFPKRA